MKYKYTKCAPSYVEPAKPASPPGGHPQQSVHCGRAQTHGQLYNLGVLRVTQQSSQLPQSLQDLVQNKCSMVGQGQ